MDFLGLVFSNDAIFDWLTELARTEYAKMTLAFIIAARLHRNWVKKDMTEQFSRIADAIKDVGAKLEGHAEQIDDLSERVDKLEKTITL